MKTNLLLFLFTATYTLALPAFAQNAVPIQVNPQSSAGPYAAPSTGNPSYYSQTPGQNPVQNPMLPSQVRHEIIQSGNLPSQIRYQAMRAGPLAPGGIAPYIVPQSAADLTPPPAVPTGPLTVFPAVPTATGQIEGPVSSPLGAHRIDAQVQAAPVADNRIESPQVFGPTRQVVHQPPASPATAPATQPASSATPSRR